MGTALPAGQPPQPTAGERTHILTTHAGQAAAGRKPVPPRSVSGSPQDSGDAARAPLPYGSECNSL